jgi:hypothetical protein
MVIEERTRDQDLVYEIEPAVQDQLATFRPGQWVALTPSRVVAVGGSPSEVYEAARSQGIDAPIIYEVPSGESGAYYF